MTDSLNRGVKVVAKKLLYQGFFRLEEYTIKVFQEGAGATKVQRRELVMRPPAVVVLPYDPEQDVLVLVEQFRIGRVNDGQQAWMLEAVAGMIETNEKPEQTAIRELKEETGLDARSALHPIGCYYPSAGGCDEYLICYWCEVDSSQAKQWAGSDLGEQILVRKIARKKVFQALFDGKIKVLPLAFVLYWFNHHLTHQEPVSIPPIE